MSLENVFGNHCLARALHRLGVDCENGPQFAVYGGTVRGVFSQAKRINAWYHHGELFVDPTPKPPFLV